MLSLTDVSLLLSLLLWFMAIIGLVKTGINKIRKRDAKKSLYFSLIALLMGIGLFSLGLDLSVSQIVLVVGMAFAGSLGLSVLVLLVRLIKRKPVKKSLIWSATSLALIIISVVSFSAIGDWERNEAYKNREIHEEPIQIDYNFEIVDGDAPIEVIPFEQRDAFGTTQIKVYDTNYLDMLLDEGELTASDCKKIIDENSNIPSHIKPYFKDFIDRIATTYPDATLTIIGHNLKTLRVEELTSREFLKKTMSMATLGIYYCNENAIYIPDDTKYVEGEFGYQVLIHEFCHACRTCWKDGNSANQTRFMTNIDYRILEESMNTVFSCSLLSYDERDLAYQVASNYLTIMLDCMDNYDLGDYMNHSDTYFLSKLDEATGYTNYASVIWKLIALQRSDYEKDNIDMSPDKYYPIYDFLSDMYYSKYVRPSMTYDQARKVADDLVDRAFYDAPENYKIDPDRFYENFDNYWNNMK